MKKLHLYVLLVVAVNLVTFVWIPSGQVFAQDQLNHGASLLDNKDCAGALPYLEDGPQLTGAQSEEMLQVFGGDFFHYFLWFN